MTVQTLPIVHVLLVGQSEEDLNRIADNLSSKKHPRYYVNYARSLKSALDYIIQAPSHDIVIVNFELTKKRSGETFAHILTNSVPVPVVFLVEANEERLAREQFTGNDFQFMSREEINLPGLSSRIRDRIVRYREDEALKSSAKYFAQISDETPVMMWSTNDRGDFTYFNRTWLKFRGSALDLEIQGAWVKDIHTADYPNYRAAFQEAYENEKSFQIEYRLKNALGEYRWILDTATPRLTPTGRFIGFLGAAVDVTDQKNYQTITHEWKSRYKAAVAASQQILYDWNPHTNQVTYGGCLEEILGYTTEELGGVLNKWLALIHKDDLDDFNAEIERVQQPGDHFQLEYRVRHKDGHYVDLSDSGRFVLDQDGKIVRMVGFLSDVTEKRSSIAALKEREESYRNLVDNIPGAVYRSRSPDGRKWVLDYASAEIETITGYTQARFGDFEGRLLEKVIHPEDRAERDRAIAESAHTEEPYFIQYRVIRANSEVATVNERGRVARRKNGTRLCLEGIIFDATEKVNAEKKMNYLAHHDHLTGLPNRLLFLDRLNQSVIEAHLSSELIAVFFIDVDHFKRINDTLGHGIGDKLIQMAAGRFSHVTYDSDTVTRVGGDEFIVLLKGLKTPADALKIADRVFSVFRTPFFIDGHELFMTCSIGISVYPNDGCDADTLLKNADTAMNRAKDQGRNRYQLYSAQMSDKALSRLTMEAHLQHALERNEFRIHYQPQIHVQTGRVICLEALVRWHHPELGMIPPSDFIRIAEENGLIVPIGEWVTGAACRQMKDWQMMGIQSLRVAVNLSGKQMGSPDFARSASRIVAESGLDPSLVEFEITESVVMENTDLAISVLNELKAHGMRTAIDDFGTGYSSLSRLKKFPLNNLKIDRSFIKDIPRDSDDTAIAEAIISLAHSMNLEVTAEGVETEDQMNFLRSKGCDAMQGFLFSRPLTAGDCEFFLTHPSSRGFTRTRGER